MTTKITDHCGQITSLTRVIILVILAILFGCNYRQFTNFTILTSSLSSSILQQMQTWDFGNAIAALVAVGGYMTEHLFSRKQVSADAHICCDVDCIMQQSLLQNVYELTKHFHPPNQLTNHFQLRHKWRSKWSE